MWAAIAAIIGLISTVLAYKLADNKTVEQKIIDDINRKRKRRSKIKGDQMAVFDRDLLKRTQLLLQLKKDHTPPE